jgi:hypothetical protein
MGRISFQSADTGANGLARIEANVSNDFPNPSGSRIIFSTKDTGGTYAERLKITEAGNVEVNGALQLGGNLDLNGNQITESANGTMLVLDRTTSDGLVIEVKDDGTSVGGVGAAGNYLYAGFSTSALLFGGGSATIMPYNMNTGQPTSNVTDLGNISNKFKNIYLAGILYSGGGAEFSAEIDVDGDVTIDNRNKLRLADAGVDKAFIGLNQGKYLFMGSEGTNSDPRIRFDGESSQAAIVPTLPAGATTAGASGYLNLGSTVSGFKDLYLDGGVYLGGETATANKLDDYEEGTWTPTVSSGTVTADNAWYIKVGKLVTVSAKIDAPSENSSGTAFYVEGLPFTSKASDHIAVGSMMGDYVSGGPYFPYISDNATNMRFFAQTSGGFSNLTYADTSGSTSIYFTLTYHTQ